MRSVSVIVAKGLGLHRQVTSSCTYIDPHVHGLDGPFAHHPNSTTKACRICSILLTLTRLGPHPDDEKAMELTGDRKQAFIDREMGRRIWSTICAQEW
jgi:hypothetical protein